MSSNYIHNLILYFNSRFGPPPASKSAIEALKKTHISEYLNTNQEC